MAELLVMPMGGLVAGFEDAARKTGFPRARE
jgi:hypothetical protein